MKSFKEFTNTDEALTVQQRLKKSRQFKKIKAKIAMGRKKAARKIASPEKLKKKQDMLQNNTRSNQKN